MKSRIVWFVAGSAAGVYSAAKARRVAYRLSAPGIVDQAGALGLGWRSFSAELRDGMAAHEQEIARRLMPDADAPQALATPPTLSLDEAHPDTIGSDTTRPDKKAP